MSKKLEDKQVIVLDSNSSVESCLEVLKEIKNGDSIVIFDDIPSMLLDRKPSSFNR